MKKILAAWLCILLSAYLSACAHPQFPHPLTVRPSQGAGGDDREAVLFQEQWKIVLEKYFARFPNEQEAKEQCRARRMSGCLDTNSRYVTPEEFANLLQSREERVRVALMDERTLYVRIEQFDLRTHLEFFEKLFPLVYRVHPRIPDLVEFRENSELILDLRGNPGGMNVSAERIAAFFSKNPNDIIKIERLRDREEITTVGNAAISHLTRGVFASLKIVVLINQWTASAAEMLAEFLKQKGVATVGERTFGKGTVQGIFPLSDGGALSVTIARYFVGNGGMDIEGKGIEPDYPVDSDTVTNEKDPQFEQAMVLLRKSDPKSTQIVPIIPIIPKGP